MSQQTFPNGSSLSASGIRYEKQCHCSGPSSTGRIILSNEIHFDNSGWKATATWHPEPVCDVCDRPWQRIERGMEAAT
jgi:hypothetical protein